MPPAGPAAIPGIPDSTAIVQADSVSEGWVDSAFAGRPEAGADSLRAERIPRSFAPRALWVVRSDLAEPRHLADTIAWADSAGFTDLFIQVRGRADAYYPSAIVPRAEELLGKRNLDRDPFAEAIAIAHARGLRVHAWINVFLAWSAPERPRSPDHLVNSHPDWFVWILARGGRIPRSTLNLRRNNLDALDIEGHFLSPYHPEVGAHLEAVVRELVAAYPMEGLHFDYARLPKMLKSYDPLSRTSFRSKYGVDPLDLRDVRSARAHLGASEAESLQASWQRWNEDRVTEVVSRLAGAARQVRPGILISAAVYPDPARARSERSQAWDRWLAGGVIDVAVPMCYAPQEDVVLADLKAARDASDGRMWAGLGLYNKPLDRALAGAQLAAALGYEGIALFSHGAARGAGVGSGPIIAAALAAFAASAR